MDPDPLSWVKLAFISVESQEETDQLTYRINIAGRLLSTDEIADMVRLHQAVELLPAFPLPSDRALFLTNDGEVLAANRRSPRTDKNPVRIISAREDDLIIAHRMQYFEMLRPYGVTREDLALLNYPMELDNALDRYADRVVRNNRLRLNTNSNILRVDVSYTPVDSGLKSFRTTVETVLASSIGPGSIMPVRQAPWVYAVNQSWAVIVPQLLNYMFFLDDTRREHWGVLPFARQTRIGLMAHREHPIFDDIPTTMPRSEFNASNRLVKVFQDERVGFVPDGYSIVNWMCNVVRKIKQENGNMLVCFGYIFDSILANTIALGSDMEVRMILGDIIQYVDPGLGGHRMYVPGTLRFNKDVFVFDPGELVEVIGHDLNKQYRYLILPHQEHIPAGLGYSLTMLPWLIRNGTWRKFERECASALFSLTEEEKQALELYGVQLVDRARLRLVTSNEDNSESDSKSNISESMRQWSVNE